MAPSRSRAACALAALALIGAADAQATQFSALRVYSSSTAAGALNLVELAVFSASGEMVTFGKTPTVSGGTVNAGAATALTDLSMSAPGDTGFRYTFAAGATASIVINFTAPVAVSYVVVVVRSAYAGTWATTAVQSYAAGASLELYTSTGSLGWSSVLGAATDTGNVRVFQPDPFVSGITLPDPPAQTAEQLTNGVRYIYISPSASFVYLREIIALDSRNINVASGRVAGGSIAGLNTGASSVTGANAFLTDMIIDSQGTGSTQGTSTSGNTWSNSASSLSNGVLLDLGAAYTLKKIGFVYYQCTGCASGEVSASTRNNGARIRLFNGNGTILTDMAGPSVATYGVNAAVLDVPTIVTATATATPTPTASSTPSPSQTPSRTATASITSTGSNTPSSSATPTASLPAGLSPTQTSSVTASPSTTRTPSGTVTASPSTTGTPTQTPSSTPVFAVGVRVVTTLVGGYLPITELMAFDVNGRLLTGHADVVPASFPAARDVNATSVSSGAYIPFYAADLQADTHFNTQWAQTNASTAARPREAVQIVFAAPVQVARVYVHVRKSLAAQMATAGATVELLSLSGGVLASRPVNWNAHVLTAAFADYVGPPALPPGAVPTTTDAAAANSTMARYVNIQCAFSLLSVREIIVLDYNGYNVALNKPTAVTRGGATGPPAQANDGVISGDTDAVENGYVSSACGTPTTLTQITIDLGALYWVKSVLFYGRIDTTGTGANYFTRMNGAPINLLANDGTTVGTYTIQGANGVVLTWNANLQPPTPSVTASPSLTPSPSTTASNTGTPSLTVGALPSVSTSRSSSPTASVTASVTASPSTSPSATRANPATTLVSAVRLLGTGSSVALSVVELQVWGPDGTLLAGTGSLSAQGGDASVNDASFASDGDADPCSARYALTATGTAEPASFTFTLAAPSLVSRVVWVQRRGSFSGNTYSATATNLVAAAATLNVQAQLLMAAGDVLESRPANRATNIQTVTFSAPVTAPVYPAAGTTFPSSDLRGLVRYVRMHCWFSLLSIREMQVFDAAGRNVALLKNAWTNYQPTGVVAGLVPAGAVDGIVNGDWQAYPNETDAFLSASCPTPLGSGASVAFWQVDLGAPTDVRRITFWNRNPATGSTGDYTRNVGAPFVLLNSFNDSLTGARINGFDPAATVNDFVPGAAFNLPAANFAQSFTVDLSTVAVPSATAAATLTPTMTASFTQNYVPPSPSGTPSGSATNTASSTASPTATLSTGAAPSGTATPTGSRSLSPSASVSSSVQPTPPPTPSPSATPGVASGLRITIGGGVCLSLYEVMAFDPAGRLLTGPASTATATSVLNDDAATYGAQNAVDLLMTDPTATFASLVGANAPTFSAGCNITDSLTITFPADRRNSPVGRVYVVNNANSDFNAQRLVSGGATLSLLDGSGAAYATRPLTGATITELNFYTGASLVPVTVDTTSPRQSADNYLQSLVRYVRVTAPNPATGGVPLRLREVMVFDDAGVNVALGKPSSQGSFTNSTNASVVWAPEKCNDGVLDFDTGAGGTLCSTGGTDRFLPGFPTNNTNWYQIDLGGMFNVTTTVIFNRAGATFQTQLNGGSVTLYNAYGQVVGSASGRALTSAPIQTLTYTLFAPSPLPTPTATASTTPSVTPTLSATPSVTASPSATRSVTTTPSGTKSGTASPSTTRTGTPTPTTTRSASGTPSAAGTATATPTPTRSGTPEPTGTRTRTPTPSASNTASVSATSSETASVSASGTGSASPSGTQTGTPSPSGTQSGTPSPSGSGTPAATGTGTGTVAPTPSGTAASTVSSSKSRLPSASPTRTRSGTATRTKTASKTATRTKTKTKTRTKTASKKKLMMA